MLYLLILIIPLLLYAAISALVLFHLKRYALAGDFTKKLITGFFVISAILIIFSVWSFFNIPWDELNLAEMIQNINRPSEFYQ